MIPTDQHGSVRTPLLVHVRLDRRAVTLCGNQGLDGHAFTSCSILCWAEVDFTHFSSVSRFLDMRHWVLSRRGHSASKTDAIHDISWYLRVAGGLRVTSLVTFSLPCSQLMYMMDTSASAPLNSLEPKIIYDEYMELDNLSVDLERLLCSAASTYYGSAHSGSISHRTPTTQY